MTITTKLYTFFCGRQVGIDPFGNKYYRARGPAHGESSAYDARRKEKRWVMYKGTPEPSKVPPEWHGWLHYITDDLPTVKSRPHYKWQKPHLPNLSGTKAAYLPPGHLLKSAAHAPTTAEYEAWKP